MKKLGLTWGVYAGDRLLAAFATSQHAMEWCPENLRTTRTEARPLPETPAETPWNAARSAILDEVINTLLDSNIPEVAALAAISVVSNMAGKQIKPQAGGCDVVMSTVIPHGCAVVVDNGRVIMVNLGSDA